MNWPATFVVALFVFPTAIPMAALLLKWRVQRATDHASCEDRLLSKRLVLQAATRGLRFKVLLLLCAVFAAAIYQWALGSRTITLILFIGYTMLFPIWSLWPFWTRHQREDLRRRQYLVCPRCEYDLRVNTTTSTCPECGLTYTDASVKWIWMRAIERGLRS